MSEEELENFLHAPQAHHTYGLPKTPSPTPKLEPWERPFNTWTNESLETTAADKTTTKQRETAAAAQSTATSLPTSLPYQIQASINSNPRPKKDSKQKTKAQKRSDIILTEPNDPHSSTSEFNTHKTTSTTMLTSMLSIHNKPTTIEPVYTTPANVEPYKETMPNPSSSATAKPPQSGLQSFHPQQNTPSNFYANLNIIQSPQNLSFVSSHNLHLETIEGSTNLEMSSRSTRRRDSSAPPGLKNPNPSDTMATPSTSKKLNKFLKQLLLYGGQNGQNPKTNTRKTPKRDSSAPPGLKNPDPSDARATPSTSAKFHKQFQKSPLKGENQAKPFTKQGDSGQPRHAHDPNDQQPRHAPKGINHTNKTKKFGQTHKQSCSPPLMVTHQSTNVATPTLPNQKPQPGHAHHLHTKSPNQPKSPISGQNESHATADKTSKSTQLGSAHQDDEQSPAHNDEEQSSTHKSDKQSSARQGDEQGSAQQDNRPSPSYHVDNQQEKLETAVQKGNARASTPSPTPFPPPHQQRASNTPSNPRRHTRCLHRP